MRARNWLLWTLPPLGLIALVMTQKKSDSVPPPAPINPAPGGAVRTPRESVVFAALSQVGNGDPKPYWDDVLPGVNVGKADWCGAFALWALHQAGLALDRKWVIGRGFLLVGSHPLPQTTNPQPGDIAYFNKNQHHAIVEFVSTGAVQLINGNGAGGKVSVSTVPKSSVTAFFSIKPLLDQAAGANA